MPLPLDSGFLSGRLQASLAILLMPFALSACVIEEITEEQIDVVFEAGGVLKYDHSGIGLIGEEDLDATDLAELLDEIREGINSQGLRSFEEGYFESGLERVGERDVSMFLSGRILPDSGIDVSGPDDVVFIRWDDGRWQVRIDPDRNLTHDKMICFTVQDGWQIIRQEGLFPELSVGQTTCGNWTELQDGYPADEFHIIYNP